MSSTQTTKCTRNSWLVGLAVGLIVGYFLLNFLGLNFYLSLFLGSVVFALGGKYLVNRFCVDSADQGSDAVRPTLVSTSAPKPEAQPAPEPEAAPQAPATPPSNGVSPSAVKSSAALPGQAELAARKGSWRYQGGADQA